MERIELDAEGRGTSGPARILYLIVTMPVGGAEEHLLSLVRILDQNRFDPTVCSIGGSGPIGREIETGGTRVVELGKLKEGGYDGKIVALLHAHLYHANMYGQLAVFREGVPALCSIHNTYVRPKPHHRFVNWCLARVTPRTIAGTKAIREKILELCRNRDIAKSKGESALGRVSEFSWETYDQRLVSLYRELMGGSAAG